MCPGCLAVMVAGVMSSGGLTAVMVKVLSAKGRRKLESKNNMEREK